VHENGYTRMNAKLDYSIPDLASIRGMLLFEMMAPKFNAIAYVDACLDFVDWCAGARGIVSSKGLAACLKIDVLFDDWTPGFGYLWGDTFPTLYFSGCDVGEYKEQISSPLVDHVTAVPARAHAAAALSQKTIELPAGLPGATIVAKGGGAPPRITLVGPNGERVSTPDGLQPVERKPFLLLKDPRANLTQIAVGKPAGGRWKVIVEPGSAPVVSLKSAQGLERPRIRAASTSASRCMGTSGGKGGEAAMLSAGRRARIGEPLRLAPRVCPGSVHRPAGVRLTACSRSPGDRRLAALSCPPSSSRRSWSARRSWPPSTS